MQNCSTRYKEAQCNVKQTKRKKRDAKSNVEKTQCYAERRKATRKRHVVTETRLEVIQSFTHQPLRCSVDQTPYKRSPFIEMEENYYSELLATFEA